jgi:hypothetical protein
MGNGSPKEADRFTDLGRAVPGEACMPITFYCPRCARKLRAPDNAAGQSSTCPGCGNRVACPEPVYDAEVVEMTVKQPKAKVVEMTLLQPPAVDPYADLDDGKPYGLVNGPAAEQTDSLGAEGRRPCPMCGELIVASAAKCRFCGEVFDQTLRKKKGKNAGKSASRSPRVSAASASREIVVGGLCLVAGLGMTIVSFANAQAGKNSGRYFIWYGLIIGGVVGIVRGIQAQAGSSR